MKIFLSFFMCLLNLMSFSQENDKNIVPFLDEIVSRFPNVRDIALTTTNDEAIFSAQSAMSDLSVLVSVKKINGQWMNPKVISFSGRYFDLEPFFSKDGLTLYFVSNRPLDQTSTTVKDFDIWYVQRESKNEEWSLPLNMGGPINTDMDEFYPCITDSKNLYFTLDNSDLKQKDDIYVSEYIDGNYTQPRRLGDTINSEGYEFNAYVASDESFMIYTCYNKEGGLGSGDLYSSTRSENGEWSVGKNMGHHINSEKMEYCPFVDETAGILYFTSKRNNIKTPTFKSKVNLKELLEIYDTYENGMSRLYQFKLEDYITKQEK